MWTEHLGQEKVLLVFENNTKGGNLLMQKWQAYAHSVTKREAVTQLYIQTAPQRQVQVLATSPKSNVLWAPQRLLL